MAELLALTARELLAGYANHDFSPTEVVDAVGDRIAEVDGTVGAFTTLCLDRAREEARATERGERKGPLAGIPIGVKDLFDSADVRGSRFCLELLEMREQGALGQRMQVRCPSYS